MIKMKSCTVYTIALSMTIRMIFIKFSREEISMTPEALDRLCCFQILNVIIPVVKTFCANANGYIVLIQCSIVSKGAVPGWVNQKKIIALVPVER